MRILERKKEKEALVGQYYVVANFDKKEFMSSNFGLKLTEWSYNRNLLVVSMQEKMATDWKGDRVYVVGDYADSESEIKNTELIRNLEDEFINNTEFDSLYDMIYDTFNKIDFVDSKEKEYRFIINHKKRQYVDMEHCPLDVHLGAFESLGKWYHATMAPLPILLALGNGVGGGDYFGHNEDLVGEWAQDSDALEISEEMLYPQYKEFNPDFHSGEFIPYTEKEKRIQKEKNKIRRFDNRER